MSDLRGRLPLIAGACLVVGAALLIWKMRLFFHDDAFISLRYARHLALNGELAWNLGERVEGYTNLLHVLLAAGLIKLGVAPMIAAQGINAVAFVALLIGAWRLTALATQDTGLRLAAMIPAASAPVIGWVFGGLEAVLSAAFIVLALVLVAPVFAGRTGVARTLAGSALFALAYLTRPDAVVANFALGLAILAFAPIGLRAKLAHFVAVGAISALVLAGHVAIRHGYYGEWLPLTFYAKVGISTGVRLMNGLEYAARSLWSFPALIALVVLALGTRGQERTSPAARLALAGLLVAGVQTVYIVWSGGDHMNHARIFVPVVPAMVLGVAGLLASAPGLLATQAAIALSVLFLGQAALHRFEEADPAASYGAFMGQQIAAHFPEPKLIALATAGSTPFFADQHTYIDTLGLNDPVIAKRDPLPLRSAVQNYPGHAKGDGAYVLSRKPDVIIFGTAVGNPPDEPIFLNDIELLDDPEFERCYQLKRFPVVLPKDFPLTLPDMSETPEFMYMQRVCD